MNCCENGKTTNVSDIKWIIICVVLLLWSLVLLLKINGVWDYSSKYDIECISGAEELNRLFLIDNDYETVWGLYGDKHSYGELLTFRFKHVRSFSKIKIVNSSSMDTKKMNIQVSIDGENFEECVYQLIDTGDGCSEYLFEQQYNGQYLRFEYADEEEGEWPIAEVEMYE